MTEASLGHLLRQLTEAMTSRSRMPIHLQADEEVSLLPDVQVTLYRLAQEALNNVAKHADASTASVSLRAIAGEVKLVIDDDGRGFDSGQVQPQSLGLDIMGERANRAGVNLDIDSAPNSGTRVTAAWQVNGKGGP